MSQARGDVWRDATKAAAIAQPLCRAVDDFVRHRADRAEFLRDDQIRREPFEQIGIEMI